MPSKFSDVYITNFVQATVDAAKGDLEGDAPADLNNFEKVGAAIDNDDAFATTIRDEISTGLSAKVDTSTYNSEKKFRGTYLTLAALQAAVPVGNSGDRAYVDAGVGEDPEVYIWDEDDQDWKLGGGNGTVLTVNNEIPDPETGNVTIPLILPTVVDSTYTNLGATPSIDLGTDKACKVFKRTMNSNVTSLAFTNGLEGYVYRLRITVDGTGGYTFAYSHTNFETTDGVALDMPSTAGAIHDYYIEKNGSKYTVTPHYNRA